MHPRIALLVTVFASITLQTALCNGSQKTQRYHAVAPPVTATFNLLQPGQAVTSQLSGASYYKVLCPSTSHAASHRAVIKAKFGDDKSSRTPVVHAVASASEVPTLKSYDWHSQNKHQEHVTLEVHSGRPQHGQYGGWNGQTVLYVALIVDPDFAPVEKLGLPRMLSASVECQSKSLPAPLVRSLSTTGDDPTYTPLQSGVPMTQTTPGATYAYYSFTVGATPGELHFSVTPSLGDPDLYITTETCTPGSHCSQWASNRFGVDSVTIEANDPKACKSCTYHIGVYAFTETTYEIVASAQDTETELLDGVPVSLQADSGTMTYYKVTPTGTSSLLTITATAITGDPDIYVSQATHHPNHLHHQASSVNFGSDTLVIAPVCHDCTYYIGISAYGNVNLTATIEASFGEPTQLSLGSPFTGNVSQTRSNQFTVEIPKPTTAMNLTVTLEVQSGRARMLINNHIHGFPNTTQSDYHTYSWEEDQSLNIPVFGNCSASGSVCQYDILVANGNFGGDGFAVYTITAQLSHGQNNRSHTRLVADRPVTVDVEAGGNAYFSFDSVTTGADLTFTATAITGDPDLYISYPSSDNPFPNETKNDQASRLYGSDILVVPAADTQLGSYFIDVHGFTATRVELLASVGSSGAQTTLIDGVPMHGSVQRGQYSYFRFTVADRGTILKVDLTAQQGRLACLMVANFGDELPTRTSYTYADSLQLLVTNARVGGYVVGVYGYMSTEFDITATTSGTIQELTAGVPLEDSILTQYGYNYYDILVDHWQPGDRIHVEVTPQLSGGEGDPDLYVSARVTHPNRTASQWESRNIGGDHVDIAYDDANACGRCRYFIGVECFTSRCDYTIVAGIPPNSEMELLTGEIQDGYVNTGETIYYKYEGVPGISQVQFKLVTYDGPVPTLYATTKETPQPSATNHYWEGSTDGNTNSLTVASSDPHFCDGGCFYHLAVPGSLRASTYTIVALVRR